MSLLFRRGLMGGGGGSCPDFDYEDVLINTYGADEVWPLVDIASGTTITAAVASARNGTLSGWDLKNAAGPFPCTFAPYSNDNADYGDIYSASLSGIFNGDVGSLFCWLKLSTWTDGLTQYILLLQVDANNYFYVRKSSTNNRITISRTGSGSALNVNVNSLSYTDWFSLGLSWDVNAGVDGEMKVFVQGAQSGSTSTGLGAFVGSLSSALTLVGSANKAALPLKGWIAYPAVNFGSAWTPTQFAEMHAAINP